MEISIGVCQSNFCNTKCTTGGFSEYQEVFGLPIFTEKPEWSAIYDEQIQEIQRLSDGQSVVDDIRLQCTEELRSTVYWDTHRETSVFFVSWLCKTFYMFGIPVQLCQRHL